MWNLVLFHLETVLGSVHDCCTVCVKHTIGLEIIMDAPNALLGDEAQVKARFSPFGHCANLDTRLVHSLLRMYHRLGNHF
jgi:hypothetical protein